MQMILYNYLLFPTLSTVYVTLIKTYNGSLFNSLTPHNIKAYVHRISLYMQNSWTSCHNMSSIFLYINFH